MKAKNIILITITTILSFFIGSFAMYMLIINVPLKTEYIDKTVIKYEVSEEVLTETIERVHDSVVAVQSYYKNKLIGTGTGFVYKVDNDFGYIMTNAHVIEDGDEVSILFSNKNTIEAITVGYDIYADVAILKVPKKEILKIAELGNSELEKLGSTVFAVGTPMGIEYSGTVTRGVLSGKERLVPVNIGGDEWLVKVLQTDAAINPGNSGGPLFNLAGEVIGINTLKIVIDEVEGMGFAIPIEDAKKYAEQLEKGEKISRPYIGIEIVDVNDKYNVYIKDIKVDKSIKNGMIIVNVVKDTPAEKGGLIRGDIITHINNVEIKSMKEFRYELYKNEIGSKTKITINRNNQIIIKELILEDINS